MSKTIKHSKRFRAATEGVDKTKKLGLKDATTLLMSLPAARFDETVEISIALHRDPKRSDQLVRGTVVLPHGTGKATRVAVFCQGEQVAQAQSAGADSVGGGELIRKIQDGWLDFDVAVATPAMMRELSKVAKILGPRGMMPSPKAGTVTDDVAKAVAEVKRGKVEFRQDKQGNIQVIVGKRSFQESQLVENGQAMCEAIRHARPASTRGALVRSATLAASMSPGIPLDIDSLFSGAR